VVAQLRRGGTTLPPGRSLEAASVLSCGLGAIRGLPVAASSGSHAGVARVGVMGPCVLAVSCGCFIAAPIATPGVPTGVGHRINTDVRRSRRQPRRPAIGWTPLVLWIAQKRSGRPQRSTSRTANRKRAPARRSTAIDARAFRRRRCGKPGCACQADPHPAPTAPTGNGLAKSPARPSPDASPPHQCGQPGPNPWSALTAHAKTPAHAQT
jgi:hypothetical protein